MQRILPAFLLVWIDHGADENWGSMCYPPPKVLPGNGVCGQWRASASKVTGPLF